MKREHDNEEFIRRLVALKRYEQPDAHFETRNLAKLREQLADTAPGGAWYSRWFDALASSPLPGFRVLVTACLLALLAVNLLLVNQVPNLEPAAEPVAEIPVATSEVLQVAATNDAFDSFRKPVFVFEYPSNRQPVGPVQMGPASMPVRLDY